MEFKKHSQKAKEFVKKTKKMKDHFPKGFKDIHLKRKNVVALIPNLITLTGLCVGLSSIRFAFNQQFEYAVIAILIAAVLDMMDGGLARMLNSASAIGAELDSLSDLVCFGVAPALILYMKGLKNLEHFGWIVVLLYVCCMALRLARFNVLSHGPEKPDWSCQFFLGVPAPMGAYLSLSPIMVSLFNPCFEFSDLFYALFVTVISLLLVSRIPTFSVKKVSVQQKYVLPIMLGAVFLIGFFLTEHWLALSCLALSYLLSIPFSIKFYKKLQKKQIVLIN
ncbi:MAG: CDP-diacylglycerol--serine O-phosphatidyltransferase [Proteobacteria bacterium]|nr:CDP-diacylglycerol--serine O-phosphatidyltransferase [Pseudomonadota bacterium]